LELGGRDGKLRSRKKQRRGGLEGRYRREKRKLDSLLLGCRQAPKPDWELDERTKGSLQEK